MDRAEIELVTSPQGQALLAGLPQYDPATALATAERLRGQGHSAQLVAATLTQSRLRAAARPRWGDWVDQLVLTPLGIEQATRPVVARHRAKRISGAGLSAMADLGCGLGLDAIAMAERGVRVVAVDHDPATACAARLNASSLGLHDRIEVRCADVQSLAMEALLNQVDGVYVDPSRRANGRRLHRPEQWLPPLPWVLSLPLDTLAVKVAPGLAHEAVPDDCEFEVVSVDADVVEGGLYRGALRGGATQRRATLLPQGVTITDRDLPSTAPEVGPVGRFLWEPDGAVIRAGLVAVVAERLQGRLLDPHIAYVTADVDAEIPLATRYAVTDVLAFNLKRLQALLRQRKVGRVTIKKRGFAATPETIRKQLRLDRSQPGAATMVLTRARGQPLAIMVEPTRATH